MTDSTAPSQYDVPLSVVQHQEVLTITVSAERNSKSTNISVGIHNAPSVEQALAEFDRAWEGMLRRVGGAA